MTPDTIIEEIIQAEGDDYTNDPSDSGGPTKYGITQATLSRYLDRAVSPEEVAALTRQDAHDIYRDMYWYEPKLDLLGDVSMRVAAEVMDTGVNCPMEVAVKMLQRQLNAMNHRATLYADIAEDGLVGPATAAALRAYIGHRGRAGMRALVVALNGEQTVYYRRLVERREKDEKWNYGWLTQRVVAHV